MWNILNFDTLALCKISRNTKINYDAEWLNQGWQIHDTWKDFEGTQNIKIYFTLITQ